MATQFTRINDLLGNGGPFRQLSDKVISVTLVADTDATLTVPTGYNACIINSDGDVWVNKDAVAVIPSSGTFTENDSELNPLAIYVGTQEKATAVSVLHFISHGTPDVSVAFFQIP